MISNAIFEQCVLRAGLAPTVHNTQPARWSQRNGALVLSCDTDVGLTIGDPAGRDAGLSCGAVLEAMVLALSAHNIGVEVLILDADLSPGQGGVDVATLVLKQSTVDPLHTQLERRFTWRGPFDETVGPPEFGPRPDMTPVTSLAHRTFIAHQNDLASFHIMQDRHFRRELVDWMRLSNKHPRAGLDGMDQSALRMSPFEARMAGISLTTLWPVLNAVRATKSITSEANVTLTSPCIALFHRDISESPIISGRAYLRLCLNAARLGMAGWPMAALSDHAPSHDALQGRFTIPTDHRIIQAIRFGRPTGEAPTRSRRPLREVVV